MKHITMEEWIDFVNHVVSQEQQAAMQKHLGTACKRCMETMAQWQKIRNTAAREASYQPPVAAVRIAKAAFAAAGRATQEAEEARFRPSALRQFFAAVGGGERGPAEWEQGKCSTALIPTRSMSRSKRSREAMASWSLDNCWTSARRGLSAATVEITLSDHRGEFHPYDDESVWRVSRRDRKHWRFGAFVSRQERKIHRDLAQKCAG